MKRRRLERRTPLARGLPLARTPMKKGMPLARRSPPRAKPKPRREPEEARLSRLWWEAVTGKGKKPCVRCGSAWHTQGHHVISQQELRRYARAHGLDPVPLLWAVEVGLCVCPTCHANHEAAVERIPRSLLSADNLAFAASLGLSYLIDRYYPGVA